jgi:predicted DsbA family dithiol-disulfide isomerase
MTDFLIVAYSDYVCPWCYIGHERLERLGREHEVTVEWRPFELHPETPRSGGRLLGRLGNEARVRAYRDRIEVLARASGLTLRMPETVANSHLALEAAEFAREHGAFEALHEALFRAYFDERRDIGEIDVICDVGRAAGVDDQRLREALVEGRYAAAIDRATERARKEGIVSTPTCVFPGGFQLVGAQDYDVFVSVTLRLRQRIADGVITP